MSCDSKSFSGVGTERLARIEAAFWWRKDQNLRHAAGGHALWWLVLLIEFFARIGLVEQLENRQFYQPESPNHYDPGQILVGFMLSAIAGAQRFALEPGADYSPDFMLGGPGPDPHRHQTARSRASDRQF
jgi:hypothetical protein